MNKKELDFLEKVFTAAIEGRLYQTKSKIAKKMEEDGFVFFDERIVGKDALSAITVNGYSLTHAGGYAYCTSDRCRNAK